MEMPPIALVARLSFGAGAVANGIKAASFAMYLSVVAYFVSSTFLLWIVGAAILSFYPIDQTQHDQNLASLRTREAEVRARDAADLPLGAQA